MDCRLFEIRGPQTRVYLFIITLLIDVVLSLNETVNRPRQIRFPNRLTYFSSQGGLLRRSSVPFGLLITLTFRPTWTGGGGSGVTVLDLYFNQISKGTEQSF